MPKSKYNLSYFTTFFVMHRWPWHLVFWILHLAGRTYSYYLTILYYPNKLLIFMLCYELLFIGLVYFTLWLYKRFSKLKLLLLGVLIWTSYVALFSACLIYFMSWHPEFSELTWPIAFINNIRPYMITYVMLVLAKYFKDSFIQQWYDEQQKKMQLQSELQNLKAQISPHFLFNTMNNFYGLAEERSANLPDLMIRLSDLLRYSLYETQSPTVPLHNEISYLKNYIELEKIRLEDDLIFEFNTSLIENQGLNIAPLLLIVLVENAFKHAKKMLTAPIEIKIDLTVDQDAKMLFLIRNNCLRNRDEKGYERGIGLENLRRRLDVLYPGSQHELIVKHKDELFLVSLEINLQFLTP